MKLLYILAAILAVTLAVEDTKTEYEDSQAVASTAVKRDVSKDGQDLTVSAYSYPPQSNWQNVQQPTNNWQNTNPANNWQNTNPANNWQNTNPANNWQNTNPTNNWQNTNPANNWQNTNPANNWQNTNPTNNWGNQGSNWGYPSVQPPVQHDDWSSGTTTTKPVSVIKNEQYYGDNGNYKYEYQIGDGTHVGEEGYFTDPKKDDDSLVKKGWYSFVDANGKTYTVTYWADKTGFHAYGDHLPTPPPVPAAIQAALDKQKEAEKNKPLQDYPTQTQAPVYATQPTPVYTQQPVYNKPVGQQNYNPTYPSQQYYPPQTYPQQQYQQQYQQQQFQQQYQQQQSNYAANYV